MIEPKQLDSSFGGLPTKEQEQKVYSLEDEREIKEAPPKPKEPKMVDLTTEVRQTNIPETTEEEPKQTIDVSSSGSKVAVSLCGDIQQFPQYLEEAKKSIQNKINALESGAKEFAKAKPAIEQSLNSFVARLPDSETANKVARILDRVVFHQGGTVSSGRIKVAEFDRKESVQEIISQSKTKGENSQMLIYGGLALIALLALK